MGRFKKMYKTNRARKRQFMLLFSDTRKLNQLFNIIFIFIILSIILITIVSLWFNYKQKNIKEQLFGSWDTVFLNVDENIVHYFDEHAFIVNYSAQKIYEKVYLQGDTRIVIGSCDNSFFKIGNVKLLSGNMPQKKERLQLKKSI